MRPMTIKDASKMTEADLLAVCGLPKNCPEAIVAAVLSAIVERCTREGIALAEAAAQEQAGWRLDRKEEERLWSLKRQTSRESDPDAPCTGVTARHHRR